MFLLILIIKKDHVYHPSKELQLYFQKKTWSFLNTSYRSVSDSSFLTKLGNGIWIPLKLIVRSLSLQGIQKQRKDCQYLTIFQKFSSLLLETRKNKLNSRLYRPDNSTFKTVKFMSLGVGGHGSRSARPKWSYNDNVY